MCGRMLSTSSAAELIGHFDVDVPGEVTARVDYNVAPSREVLIVRDDAEGRHLDTARWGLIPAWAKDPSIASRTINARAETAATKPSFRAAFRRRPCLVPADGFYEWQKVPGRRTKQPYLITARDGAPLAFAGLWERWEPADGPARTTCTILTCAANTTMTPLHHRMPVILGSDSWDAWLDADDVDVAARQALLVPADDDVLSIRPVSTAVNDVRNNGPHLLDPPEVTALPGF